LNYQVTQFNIPVFWDDEYTRLDYVNEPFNDTWQTHVWQGQGYSGRFTGDMCDMRSPQPSWNHRFVELFAMMGWQDIGTSYYRMGTGTILPTHQDRYVKYIQLYDLENKKESIRRAIVFLEDWSSGHYAEYADQPLVGWTAGTVVQWNYDTPHMAANMGIRHRYTLQITGHV
jgi:hypothetical protein